MIQKPPSVWEAEKASRGKSQPTKTYSAAAVFSTLDNVFAAIVAGKIEAKHLPQCLAFVRSQFDPDYQGDLSDLTIMERCEAAMRPWIDALSSASTGEVKPLVKSAATTEAAKTETQATAADFLRASKIAAGEIIELPTDPTARAIISAAAKARNEGNNIL